MPIPIHVCVFFCFTAVSTFAAAVSIVFSNAAGAPRP